MQLKPKKPEDTLDPTRSLLEGVESTIGFVPNLMGIMAHAPETLQAYLALQKFFSKSKLGKIEREVVLLRASADNDCAYCVPAHTANSHQANVPDEIIESIREGKPLADSRLQILCELVDAVVLDRGAWLMNSRPDSSLPGSMQRTRSP